MYLQFPGMGAFFDFYSSDELTSILDVCVTIAASVSCKTVDLIRCILKMHMRDEFFFGGSLSGDREENLFVAGCRSYVRNEV
jgi:hypothetical protein